MFEDANIVTPAEKKKKPENNVKNVDNGKNNGVIIIAHEQENEFQKNNSANIGGVIEENKVDDVAKYDDVISGLPEYKPNIAKDETQDTNVTISVANFGLVHDVDHDMNYGSYQNHSNYNNYNNYNHYGSYNNYHPNAFNNNNNNNSNNINNSNNGKSNNNNGNNNNNNNNNNMNGVGNPNGMNRNITDSLSYGNSQNSKGSYKDSSSKANNFSVSRDRQYNNNNNNNNGDSGHSMTQSSERKRVFGTSIISEMRWDTERTDRTGRTPTVATVDSIGINEDQENVVVNVVSNANQYRNYNYNNGSNYKMVGSNVNSNKLGHDAIAIQNKVNNAENNDDDNDSDDLQGDFLTYGA